MECPQHKSSEIYLGIWSELHLASDNPHQLVNHLNQVGKFCSHRCSLEARGFPLLAIHGVPVMGVPPKSSTFSSGFSIINHPFYLYPDIHFLCRLISCCNCLMRLCRSSASHSQQQRHGWWLDPTIGQICPLRNRKHRSERNAGYSKMQQIVADCSESKQKNGHCHASASATLATRAAVCTDSPGLVAKGLVGASGNIG